MLNNHIDQLAWVVDDLGAAQDYWMATAGVPTFYEMPGLQAPAVNSRYRGAPGTWSCDVSIGYAGEVMIELIRPLDGPSVWHEFRAAGRTGPHHIGSFVRDLDAAAAPMLAAGCDEALTIEAAGIRAVYYDTVAQIGCYTELIQLDDAGRRFFESIRATDDPTRPL